MALQSGVWNKNSVQYLVSEYNYAKQLCLNATKHHKDIQEKAITLNKALGLDIKLPSKSKNRAMHNRINKNSAFFNETSGNTREEGI